jgi:hypothetical protein
MLMNKLVTKQHVHDSFGERYTVSHQYQHYHYHYHQYQCAKNAMHISRYIFFWFIL